MKTIKKSGQFKKDFKKYRNQESKLCSLFNILCYLECGEPIPMCFRPHLLTGQYKGCMECHIESDFLLIWFDEEKNIIKLLRLGTHSELFNK